MNPQPWSALARVSIERALNAILWLVPDGTVLYGNPRACSLLGYPPDGLNGVAAADLAPAAPGWPVDWEALRAGGALSLAADLRTRAGDCVRTEVLVHHVRDDAGEFAIATLRDLAATRTDETQRRTAELEILTTLTARLSHSATLVEMYEASMDGFCQALGVERAAILVRDAQGTMRFTAWRSLSAGYRRGVEGHTFWSPTDPDPQPVLFSDVLAEVGPSHVRDAIRAEGIGALVAFPLVASRTLLGKCMLYSAVPRAFAADEIRLGLAIAQHVALALERQQSVDALSDMNLAMLNAMPGIALLTPQGCYERVNAAYAAMLGGTPPDFIGAHWESSMVPDDRRRAVAACGRVATEGKAEFEARALRLDGTTFDKQVLVVARTDPSGAETGTYCFMRDISERRALEHQLRQAQKMEAIGRLAGGIAHDFNNLLTAIGGFATLLQNRLPEADPSARYVRNIRTSSDRAAELTRQLLAFSRRQVLEPRALCINDSIAAMEPLLRRLIGANIDLILSLASDLGTVKADPSQLEQVVLNLALNARDAMPSGGRLTIATANVPAVATDAARPVTLPEDAGVELIVSDTGLGMDADTLAHLYEPFFTTKPPGEGTGLGLATVYGIVAQSNGRIHASSRPGQGARFTMWLPRVADESAVAPVPQAALAHRGTETILLAEDEAAVRELSCEVLGDAGYQVLSATSGTDALAVARRHAGPIHLLLTDMVMPGLGGRELARALTAERPEMRVLFMSGYPLRSGELPTGHMAFVQKPMLPQALLARIRAALDLAG